MKITGPLHSDIAGGRFGKQLTFSNRKSGQQVRFQKKQKDIITADRIIQRYLFSDGISVWNSMSSIAKNIYNERAKGEAMTGYDIFMKEYLKARKLSNIIANITVIGGVHRCIDQATGDTPKTTSGWIEDEKYGWYLSVTATAVSAEFDSAITRTGKFTLKGADTNTTGKFAIYNKNATSGSALYWHTLALLKASTSYRLTCYLKTNNIPSASAYIRLYEYDSNFSTGTAHLSSLIGGTYDWRLLTVNFTSLVTAYFALLDLGSYLAGNVCDVEFDVNSLRLETVSTITNPFTFPIYYYPKATAVKITNSIDQGQLVSSNTAFVIGYTGYTGWSQQFLPKKTHFTGITFQKTPNNSGVTGNVTISLQTSSANKPTGTILASKTYTASQFNELPNSTDIFVDLTHDLTVDSSTKYFIVWLTNAVNGTNFSRIKGDSGASYTDGVLNYSPDYGVNWSVQANDLYFKTHYSRNTTNITIRTDTEIISVTADTAEGWANGEEIDTKEISGITPLTLTPGVNNIYYSSDGPHVADSTKDTSYQAIFSGSFYV